MEQAFEMVAGGSALVAGLWPMSNPLSELVAVLDGPGLKHMCVGFHATLRRLAAALVVE